MNENDQFEYKMPRPEEKKMTQIQQQMHSGSGLKQTGAIQSQLLLAQARPTLMKSSSLGDSCVCVCSKSWTWFMISDRSSPDAIQPSIFPSLPFIV